MTADFLFQLLTALVAAGIVYGGIRADLRNMHWRIRRAEEESDKAHQRLDRHVETFHRDRRQP